jgi:hydrogenase/urease accessory protein HupE
VGQVRRVGLVVLVAAASASAHPLSVSYAQYTIHDTHITVVVRLPMDDVDLLLRVDRDLDGRISAPEIEAARDRLQAYAEKHLHIRSDDVALTAGRAGIREWRDPAGAEYVELSFEYGSPSRIGRVSIRSDFLTDLYSGHKTLGDIRAAGRSDEQFVFEPSRVYELRAPAGATWRTAASFIRLGIEHIFTGYDHILFLFGLLVIGTGLRNLVAIVTSFTVAHSMTLAVATLGVVQPVPWMIEAAIALSIAYIGFENLLVQNPRYRWKITFVFGLVHGFGFATVLREMHLPRAGLVVSLFSFNAGVEIGQIAIVSVMYPVLLAIARTSYRVPISRIVSSAIAVIGLFWFCQRVRWVG